MATEIYIPNYTQMFDARTADNRVYLRLRIGVEVSGVDLCGQTFVERAETVLVAPSGGMIASGRSFVPDQQVSIRFGRRESLARVLGQSGLSESKYEYGLSFIQPNAAFWGVHFPNIAPADVPPSTALIACGSCSMQRTYVLNEIELLLLRTSRSFGLYCSSCRYSTLWKLCTASAEGHELSQDSPDYRQEVVSLATNTELPATGPQRKNERRHPRVSMAKARACVQLPRQKEEIVQLINVSRGGVSFRSKKWYPLGTWIRIAAPCTLGTANIFALGRVVRAEAVEHEREYGVEYVERSS